MRIIREILDRLILLAAILLASCIPSFIAQYRQRLGGRLDQVRADLAPFQAIADREFHGRITDLINHHIASQDTTFHQEGVAIQAMIDTVARLQDSVQALNTDLVHQCLYLVNHADYEQLQSTWNIYQPGFTLTLQGAVFALVLGVTVWLLFLAIWHGTAALLGRRHLGPRPGPGRGPTPDQNPRRRTPVRRQRGPEPRVGLD